MNERELWNIFEQSGRVEDYLRYRGIFVPAAANSVGEANEGYGKQPKTASDDRRPHRSGL
ncbi:MAG: hypothetical protein IIW40_00250 [Clostridia bacterium]|nr:hypothetical protein [Clostridia bacterium]